jgi:hypothetical protein
VVVLGCIVLGHFLSWEMPFSIGIAVVMFLMHYLENERERWQGLVSVVVNLNLNALEDFIAKHKGGS